MRLTSSRRQFLALAVSCLAARSVLAQSGAKYLRLILPNAVGSGVDALARAFQPALSAALATNVVADNQPGAGGIVGLQQLARSAPDGQTLSIVSNNVVIFPSVLKSVPFAMPGDFTPIAMLGTTPLVLVVNPANVAAGNAQQFVDLLRSKPEAFNYGSGGNGTILHLAAAQFLDQTDTKARHIPYKGVGPMVSDLIGGQIDFAVVALPTVHSQIESGRLRCIGVGSPQRIDGAPDIPTFVEQGLTDYVVEAWFALLGPKGMKAAEIQRINAAVAEASGNSAFKDAMVKQGNSIQVSSAEEAAATFRSELAKYAQLVKKAGVEPT